MNAGRHRLANGMDVRVVEDPAVPLVTLVWALPSGAASDPPGFEGAAALSVQLLGNGVLGADLEALGDNLFTRCDWDSSCIALKLLSEDLQDGLAMLCEVAQAPRFSEETLDRQRRWQLAELAKRQRQPAARVEDALAQALHAAERRGLPLLGTAGSVRRLERHHTQAFHRAFSDPRRAGFIAVGSLRSEALLRRLETLVGPAAAGETPSAGAGAVVPPARQRIVLVDAPEAAHTELRLGALGPARTDADHACFLVLNEILASRLARNLRERHGYVYSVRSRLEESRGPAPFVIALATRNENACAVVGEILREIGRLRSEPASEEELRRARERLSARAAAGFQTLQAQARHIRKMFSYGLSDADVARETDDVWGVDPRALAALAARRLDPDRMVIAVAGPAAALKSRLERSFEGTASETKPLEKRSP